MIRRLLAASLVPLLGLLLSLAPAAHAQVGLAGRTTSPIQEQLAGATTVTCSFTTQAAGDWDGSETSAEVSPIELELGFTNVNTDEGTASAGSDFGDAYIIVNYTNDYLHFMQVFRSGPIYTTTVLAVEGEDDRLLAVHTRHEFTAVALPGYTSRPEMSIGSCTVD
jgi:hypothetical protein